MYYCIVKGMYKFTFCTSLVMQVIAYMVLLVLCQLLFIYVSTTLLVQVLHEQVLILTSLEIVQPYLGRLCYV